MIVYFDESYDNQHHYMLYGALFVPPSSTLTERVMAIRKEARYTPEIHYSDCKYPRTLRVYQQVIDAFIADAAYFRCVVVDQYRFDYSGFGRPDESLGLKKGRAYKKFAEMLLHPNVSTLENAVFLADKLTRCRGDEFLEQIRLRFNPPGGKQTFRHIDEVSSAHEQNQGLQVCDLLLGCVLNNLKPAKKPTKNAIREHLLARLNVNNFLLSAWKDVPVSQARDPSVKFNVWHWSAKKRPR